MRGAKERDGDSRELNDVCKGCIARARRVTGGCRRCCCRRASRIKIAQGTRAAAVRDLRSTAGARGILSLSLAASHSLPTSGAEIPARARAIKGPICRGDLSVRFDRDYGPG